MGGDGREIKKKVNILLCSVNCWNNYSIPIVCLQDCSKMFSYYISYYLPLANRPGTGDYKMADERLSVHVSARHVLQKAPYLLGL